MSPTSTQSKFYKFGDFKLVIQTQTLARENKPIHLAKRPFEILLFLIENRERVVSRDELLDKFWEGHNVYDDALRKTVSTIRQALNDTEKPPQFIETRRGSGFWFIGKIEEIESSKSKAQSLSPTKTSFWLSRIVLISSLTVSFALLISFVVSFYLPQKEAEKHRKLKKIESIAVLPLRNLTGDSANDYLSDGLSEGIINEFSRHSELKIMSRSASFSFKEKEISLPEIGEKLKVEAILEGSLRKFGDEMWIEASLVNVQDGTILWTNDTANASVQNTFVVQNKIACDILEKIEAGNCTKIETTQNIEAEAYQLYLRGIYIRNDLSLESMTEAIQLFKKALQIAPNFAKAHEGIATTYIIMESNSQVPPSSVIKKAEFHANEALKLDKNSVDALLVLSETKTSESYDLKLRESLLRQAIEKEPNFGRARMWLTYVLTVRGKFAESENELLKLKESDPLSTGVLFTLGENYLYWRKPEEAIKTANLMHELKAPESICNRILAKAYLLKGDFEQAKIFIDKKPDNYELLHITWLTKTGKTGEARNELKKLEIAEMGKTSPFVIGYLYAQLDEKDTAFVWLEKSFKMRQSDLVSLNIEPALDNLRDDVRYKKLLERIGLSDLSKED